MSIINDALKKVQQNLSPQDSLPNSSSGQSGPDISSTTGYTNNNPVEQSQILQAVEDHNQPEEKPDDLAKIKNISRVRNLFLMVFLMSMGFVIMVVLYQLIIYIQHQYALVPKKDASQPKTTQSILPAPIFSPAAPAKTQDSASLAFSGVMLMEEKPVALINGNIYEEGEFVEGFQLQEIHADRIELIKDGKQVTVPLGG